MPNGQTLISRRCKLKPLLRRFVDIIIGVVIGFLLGIDVVFARSIDMSKAGVSLWIFICVGAFIILLQLIPAIILFTTFIGSVTKMAHDQIPIEKEDKEDRVAKVMDEMLKANNRP
jgi:L-cystine uptake protein TcyP (sodium:dicarboxylate symporter family)